MVKPTFLCIGVQKSGTTSLKHYLNQHPDIFIHNRELHFFDDHELTEAEIVKYENTFTTHKRIVGEKSPSYSYLQFAMDRIYQYNPKIKLILILREPITRAFSQYNMKHRIQNTTEEEIMSDFEKEEDIKLSQVKRNGQYYILRGKYDEIISYILLKFPRENLYIGIAEEIRANKKEEYNKIIEFLGAETLNEINESVDRAIGNYKKSIPKILEKKLYDIYKPHNERLYQILGRKIPIWEEYYDKLEST
jgi:hypothetical protein